MYVYILKILDFRFNLDNFDVKLYVFWYFIEFCNKFWGFDEFRIKIIMYEKVILFLEFC